MDLLKQYFSASHSSFTGLESRLAVFYLAITVLIVAGLWLLRGRPTSFLAYLVPRQPTVFQA